MSWLQPRLKQYSAHKSTILVVVVACLSSPSTLTESMYNLAQSTGKGSHTGAAASPLAPASAGYDFLFKFVLVGDSGKCVALHRISSNSYEAAP
jgi:hypothetical protein